MGYLYKMTRCKSYNKMRAQCLRDAKQGADYCWQHKTLKQSGGVVIFNPLIKKNKIIKQKTVDNQIFYENILTPSNDFTDEQKRDIEILLYFILPFIWVDGKRLGNNAIKDVEVLGAGTFGITIFYKKILIKIIKLVPENKYSIITEISGLIHLFGGPETVPQQINKTYGYLTMNKALDNTLGNAVKTEGQKNLSNIGIYTNIGVNFLNSKDIISSITKAKLETTGGGPGQIVTIFSEKEDMSMKDFIAIYATMPHNSHEEIKSKIGILLDYFKDMSIALNFLHSTKKRIHNDIKPDNTTVTYEKSGDTTRNVFKLIDFGLIQPISDLEQIVPRTGGTPIYFNKAFSQKSSVLYDWYCVLQSVLQLIGFLTPKLLFNDKVQLYTLGFEDFKKLIMSYLDSKRMMYPKVVTILVYLFAINQFQQNDGSLKPFDYSGHRIATITQYLEVLHYLINK
jgi:serine/threonine protein kinase